MPLGANPNLNEGGTKLPLFPILLSDAFTPPAGLPPSAFPDALATTPNASGEEGVRNGDVDGEEDPNGGGGTLPNGGGGTLPNDEAPGIRAAGVCCCC